MAATIKIVSGDREEIYGPPADNLGDIAKYWSIFTRTELTADDVCSMLEIQKISRRRQTPGYMDNYVDAAGYAALGYELANAIENLDT